MRKREHSLMYFVLNRHSLSISMRRSMHEADLVVSVASFLYFMSNGIYAIDIVIQRISSV